ncbi:ROK family protein [Rhodobacteraceae bacterium CYK-10]|uniref:N-acetylglucosamine kinase n=1 Tax=Stagnihabitans tardus TaxID=2699202 RepID=A0AAE4YAG7_9RHOB|nr:ROK family protein [Stagnihabitans tardus]
MIAAGIDLGGTKIEAQVFDALWQRVDARRMPTPRDYPGLVAAMAEMVAWAEGFGPGLPVGIAAAGLIHPVTGIALTANLAATGKPFPADIAEASGRGVTYVNDCRAQALSEAQFGAARGYPTALTLNLGTGLAGGIVVNGRLLEGPSATGGEFGHFALPAHLMTDLPLLACGCGRLGCTETLIAGPGLSRILAHRTGRELRAEEIVAGKALDPDLAQAWQVWLGLTAELIHTLVMVVDPGCIVLAGGLSRAPGLVADLSDALTRVALPGYGAPPILLAEGGDTTGARGAAYAAFAQGRAE